VALRDEIYLSPADKADDLVETMVAAVLADSENGDSPHYLIGYLESMLSSLAIQIPEVKAQIESTIMHHRVKDAKFNRSSI
jgi:hypothetical protein|tara:strand:+ start:242 stop:484 length:243 start_codon:yes stop_codon:yes gene_type:complete